MSAETLALLRLGVGTAKAVELKAVLVGRHVGAAAEILHKSQSASS